jgi:hypothetical protein
MKMELPSDPSPTALSMYSKEVIADSDGYLHHRVWIARTRKKPQSPSVDGRVSMCWIHRAEYYSALIRRKILTYATTWMSFLTLTEQYKPCTEGQTLFRSHLCEVARVGIPGRIRVVGVLSCGPWGMGNPCLMGMQFGWGRWKHCGDR